MSGSAEDRTEAASARRLARAREEGQAPVSREAAPLAVLAVATLLIGLSAPAAARAVAARLAALLGQAGTLSPAAALRTAGIAAAIGAAPFLLAGLLANLAAVLAQTGMLISVDALLPDLARLDPRRGLGRLVSPAAALEAGKALLKLLAAGAAAWSVLHGTLHRLPAALGWPPAEVLSQTTRLVLHMLLALLAAQAAIAGFDIVRARLAHASGLRMTRQELRDEHRDSEGDPRVKARLRRLRLGRMRRRMLKSVPTATVVVTNPTHYAVALAYQRGASTAPIVVAKGTDAVAARIRAIAAEHGVPLVANPPLARALHEVELDCEVPRELFAAVAELIAYVWRLRSRAVA